MSRLPGLVAGVLLTCGGAGIAAAAPQCENFEGVLQLSYLPQDLPAAIKCDTFKAIREKERIFRDTTFLYELGVSDEDPLNPICFMGKIQNATLDGQAVEASSLSAVAASKFLPGQQPPIFVAASIVTVKDPDKGKKGKELGTIYLRDTGVVDASFNAAEQLIGVGGTKGFANSSVSIEILGDELSGASVKGTICR